MEEQPKNNNQKSTTNAVQIIAYITLVAFIVAEIAFLVLITRGYFLLSEWLIFSASGVVGLILLFSLGNAIERISVLENVLLKKGIVEKNELDSVADTEGIKDNAGDIGIKLCKKCGYQLFPEDTVCPNCGTKVKDD